MLDECLKIEGKMGQYKCGDIIKINDREWVVTENCCNGITDTAVFYPLSDVVLHSSYVELAGESQPVRLSEYLALIVESYKRRQNK